MSRRVKMKLSNDTIEVLKNFSNINQNILIKEGSQVRTMSTMKNILAEADVSEDFTQEFGIYDLTEFLGVLTLVKDPNLKMEEKYLTVNGGGSNIRYFYSDPSILISPPDTFNAPDTDVHFEVSQETLANVLKASAVMQLPDVVMTRGKITVTDLKNSTSNNYDVALDDNGQDYEFNFKADNLKMIPGKYDVSVSSQALVSCWKGSKVTYWIALEQPTD